MQTHAQHLCPVARLLPVTEPEDIEYLVKESEVLTGLAGRVFVIAGAERLHYRIQWQPRGFKVERLNDEGSSLHTQHLLPWEFVDHSLVEALGAGQLFTPLVGRSH